MSFIRTVLGDIPADDLGVCYAHEHLIIDPSFPTAGQPDFLLDSTESAAAELKLFFAAGGRAVVDSMPMACGRNVLKLAAASQLSGVHVIAPTGLHLPKYYPPGHWSQRTSVEELVKLFVADITEGIDAFDNNGPMFQRTRHRAGVIKVAGGRDKLNDRERLAFIAAAYAQQETGAPILTHTEEGTAALEQIELLKDHGADLHHVVLSHTDRLPNIPYHREILSKGVRIEFDSCFRWKEGNPTLDLLTALLPEFPGQIMLGMDAARRKYWTSYDGGPGLPFLLTQFVPQLLRAGIAQEYIDRIFVQTPRETFTFIKRSDL